MIQAKRIRARRSKPGDVLEVALAHSKYAYLRYIGRHETGMDAIEVLDSARVRVPDVSLTAIMKTSYIFFSYMPHLQKSGAFKYIGNAGASVHAVKFRQAAFGGWRLPDGRIVKELDEKSANLPILEGVPEAVILERLETGWRPEFVRVNAITALLARDPRERPIARTFFRFRELQGAQIATKTLQSQGYKVSRRGRKVVIDQETSLEQLGRSGWLTSHEEMLTRICEQLGGSYEGNEIG